MNLKNLDMIEAKSNIKSLQLMVDEITKFNQNLEDHYEKAMHDDDDYNK
jgi:hypothetical protein